MYKVAYSQEKNRIYIKIEGSLSAEAFHTYKEAVINMIDHTRPGFTVLADLLSGDISILQRSDSYNVIREYGASKGVKERAVVLTDNLYNQALDMSMKNLFKTVEEAEAFLDTL